MYKESEFTRPRPDCPHPEYWTSADNDSTENEVLELVAGFIRGLQPEFVVETGTAFGYGALHIGRALKANGHGRLVTMEVDSDRCNKSRARVEGLPVVVLNLPSLEYTPSEPIDFAWFDSLIHLRVAEFRAYYDYMSARCVVGFHDTGPQHSLRPGIVQLENEGLIKPIFLPTPRGVCFAEVI